MLEKIGLPAKPSQRGSTWVVDASHCQGCSSQFTFINRKHHCRRCGGLFCNSCTQQRMVLRGQGNSPVRICEPCKKLEEVARFEMRHGPKSKVGRGSSKLMPKHEELLNEIMGDDRRESALSEREFSLDVDSSNQQSTSSASCSNIQKTTNCDEIGATRTTDDLDLSLSEVGSTTPEGLRQEALDQKKAYKILKAEGKSEQALKAFKKGKELERQADALELQMRKNRRRISSSDNTINIHKVDDETKELGRKTKLPPRHSKEKDDLAGELREIGWSDMDLQEADKMPSNLSLDGELSTLLREVSQKTNSGKGTCAIDKSQVILLKKKALALKREGKLDEAKGELKRAKILEKQIEEQELLGDAEDSDEEFSSLLHSVGIDKQDDFGIGHDTVPCFDLNNLTADDLMADVNFEVTDEDMDNPELAATLESLGWTEETTCTEDRDLYSSKEALPSKIRSLKRDAICQKKAGNPAEAMELLREAKLLERDLNSTTQGANLTVHAVESPPRVNLLDDGNVNGKKGVAPKMSSKSKLMIQKELLGLKKRALILRREGKLDEADEELKKGRILEKQLEEMNNALKGCVSLGDSGNEIANDSLGLDFGIDENVTDKDMHDPTYLSLLRNLGWTDEENGSASHLPKENDIAADMNIDNSSQSIKQGGRSKKSKSEIQRELLGLKRKSLALRRQGESEEAVEVLKMAKLLETQLAEVEAPRGGAPVADITNQKKLEIPSSSHQNVVDVGDDVVLCEEDMHDPGLLSMLKNMGWKDEEAINVQAKSCGQTPSYLEPPGNTPSTPVTRELLVSAPARTKMEIQQELLSLKRKALALKRQGESDDAEEVLKMARLLEAQLEDYQVQMKQPFSDDSNNQEGKTYFISPDKKSGNSKIFHELDEHMIRTKIKSNLVFELPEGLGKSENGKTRSSLKNADLAPETSELVEQNSQLLVDLAPHQIRSGGPRSFPTLDQSAIIMDLLAGESWSSSQSSSAQNIDQLGSVNVSKAASNAPRDSESTCVEDCKSEDIIREEQEKFTHAHEKQPINSLYHVPVTVSQNDGGSQQQDILAHKKKALALKREGKLAEAKEELRLAKALEMHLGTSNSLQQSTPSSGDISGSKTPLTARKQHGLSPTPKALSCNMVSQPAPSRDVSQPDVPSMAKQQASNSALKPLSSRDRFKLQQESLNHKRQALKLRREGRTEEAEAELELAKTLESQLDDSAAHEPVEDVTVENFLDPQLLSALKAVGLADNAVMPENSSRPVSVPATAAKTENSGEERIQLEERIKAEKVKALNLKRSGKQAEAMESLRRAKLLEKKLNSLAAG